MLDQWYFNYGTAENGGDGEWCQQVLDYVTDEKDGLNTYFPEVRNQFQSTLGWLGQWACARNFGLGTTFEYQPEQVVESLSGKH